MTTIGIVLAGAVLTQVEIDDAVGAVQANVDAANVRTLTQVSEIEGTTDIDALIGAGWLREEDRSTMEAVLRVMDGGAR
jgi:hypothetical protein